MQTYRLYFLDQGAHTSTPPIVLECADDHEAVRQAKQHITGKEMELWRGTRLVANCPRQCKGFVTSVEFPLGF